MKIGSTALTSIKIGSTAISKVYKDGILYFSLPEIVSISVEDATPTVVVLTYNIALNETSTPDISAYVISGKTVASVLVEGLTVKVTVTERYYWGDTGTIAYTKPGTNMVKSTSGGGAVSFTATAVVNNVVFDSDAQAYITAFSVTNLNQKKALDYLTKALKDELFWDDIVSILPFCNSIIGNLKNAALNATVYDDVNKRIIINNYGVYKFNQLIATSPTRYAHIKTSVISTTHLTANNINISLWLLRKPSGSTSYDFGTYQTYPIPVFYAYSDATNYLIKYNSDSLNQTIQTAIANAFWHIQMNAIATDRRDLIINGVSADNDTATNNASMSSLELFLGSVSQDSGIASASYNYHSLFVIGKHIPTAREAVYNTIIDEFVARKTHYLNFFGDSITNGYNVADVNDSFPYLLSESSGILKNSVNGNNGYRMQNTGNTSYSYYQVISTYIGDVNAIYPLAVGAKRGYVVFEFGVNDCGFNDVSNASGGTTPNTVEAFTTQYQLVLNYFVNTLLYRFDQIILLGLPYVNSTGWLGYQTAYGSTPADSARVASFNVAISALCVTNGCNYVELTASMLAGGGDALLQADGLHPNAAGHAFIAEQIELQVPNFGD
ncbi:MAG: SGNH/GDSL hydrolase family protein [Bacteroidota bacterium]